MRLACTVIAGKPPSRVICPKELVFHDVSVDSCFAHRRDGTQIAADVSEQEVAAEMLASQACAKS